jgi:ABC-type branched-subunit amino acid transport system ATPase component
MSGFEVRELSVRAPEAVLRGVDLYVAAGELVGLLGDAGGSLLVRVMAGVLPPSAGVVRAAGEDLTGRNAAELAARGIVLAPAGRGTFGGLTVLGHLLAGATFAPGGGAGGSATRAYRADRVLGWFPALVPYADRPAAALPDPEAGLLALAGAVARAPRLLLVDGLRASLRGAAPDAARAAALTGLRMACVSDDTAVVVADLADPDTNGDRDGGAHGTVDGGADGEADAFDRAFLSRNGTLRPWQAAARASQR